LALLETFKISPQSGDGTAFEALGMKEFNALVVDSPEVKYFSWGASFEPGLFDAFRWSHSVILAKEGPNDGLVSVQSAKWGEYRGTLLDVSHPDLVGWINQVRYTMAAWAGRPITFKPATFYLEVADYLAEQGY
jgi:triacylglycerol lipase